MPRKYHDERPVRACNKCGSLPAMPKHTLCPPCLKLVNLAIARQHRLHKNNHNIAVERSRQRSNKTIAKQIQWMKDNDLLPDPRRIDYNETTND
jgi:hypothetical protein